MISIIRRPKPRTIGLAAAAGVAMLTLVIVIVVLAGGDNTADSETTPAPEQAGASTTNPSASSGVGSPPDTDDPGELARWVAGVVFGMDHRDDRDAYVDATWAASLGSDADDPTAAREAFAADPKLAGIVNLVPGPDLWDRLAGHEQWSTFDVDEPIGVEPIDPGPDLTAHGASIAWVLVTGIQTIHYIGDDGTEHTQMMRPSLRMLIGCANELDGCRILHVDDQTG